jgi:2-oxoglutarate dehydrogenase complex dehydrogenase (E1) component-like enzyme
MAHRGRLNIWQNIFKSTQDIFGEFEVKITIKNILTVMLSILSTSR